MTIFSKSFWIPVAERAARTFAATEAAYFTVGISVTDVDWQRSLGVSGAAALASILFAVATGVITSSGNPSITETPNAKVDAPEVSNNA